MRNIDVAIIGAGPSGMAAAIKLFRNNIKNVIIFERNNFLGGILRQCIHTGFGIDYYKSELTGPEYASRMIKDFMDLNIEFKLNTMVIDLTPDKIITVSSAEDGISKYKARSVIIATGCRERTRENLEIPGTRPAGLFTAGQAQELINIRNFKIGKKVIIQGSGDIGLIMARRLKIEGYEVVKVFERLQFLSGLIRNKVQCLDDFNIPIEFNSQVCQVEGVDRVNGVWVERLDNEFNSIKESKKFYECDTVLFSVGLIPEVELAKKAGIEIDKNNSPEVNSKFETKIEGIFISGNCLHIHDLADNASLEGEKVADFVTEFVTNKNTFSTGIKNEIPYKLIENETMYTENFFDSLRKKMICIICPKGCIISEDNHGCKRGKTFYENEKICKRRKVTTTVFCDKDGFVKRIPVISKEEVNIEDVSKIKEELKKIKKVGKSEISIMYKNKELFFNIPKNI